MKKHLLTFAMLASVAASATVTITPLSTDYAAQKVTFKVAWTNSPTAPYNNRVWIWIDFCPVSGVTPQSFSTATITNPTGSGNGTITGLNGRGFFIEYDTTNTGTTVTATLSNAPAGQFNWCAYGSDYPPNVLANTNDSYTLAGTPPFELITTNGATTQTVNEKTFATSAITITPATITDATGYPGLWCPYTGNDLYMDDAHRCKERQSGVQNWEAWIKDTRDNELYRIVIMPDNKWWLAQNVKLAEYNNSAIGQTISGYTKDEAGMAYTWAQIYASYAGGSSSSTGNVQGICPPGWLLPVTADFNTLMSNIGDEATVSVRLRALRTKCTQQGNDYYGWAAVAPVCNYLPDSTCESCYTNDAYREDGFLIDFHGCGTARTASFNPSHIGVVRCYRQL